MLVAAWEFESTVPTNYLLSYTRTTWMTIYLDI